MASTAKGWNRVLRDAFFEHMASNRPKHCATVLNLFGVPVRGCKLNLFDKIQSMDAVYLVDTNIPWPRLSLMPEYRNSAFILGPTILRESVLRDLFENKFGPKVRKNVFVFGAFPPAPGSGLVRLSIERLDANFLSFRPKNSSYYAEIGMEDRLINPEEERLKERKKILNLLGFQSIEDFYSKPPFEADRVKLLSSINNEIPKCFKDYRKCVTVAELAFALLLLDEKSARHEFISGGANMFNDAELIHNSLFFGAIALSANRRHVGKMASYCGLSYRSSLT